jgi:aminoglycoside phosphotransferase (APT) family kinase protein
VTPVEAILRRAGIDTSGAAVRPAGAGRRNAVWTVDSDRGHLVVRALADPARLDMEVALLARCRAAGVPVPEVLWWGDGEPPAMVQRRLPGERLADVRPSAGLRADVASVLRRVHDVPIAGGYGSLTPDLRGSASRFSQWFTEHAAAEAVRAPLPAPDRALVDVALAELRDAAGFLDDRPSGLAHGDFQPENILVEGDAVTGLVDWEAAKAGPPGLDLGWWDWWGDAFQTPWTTDALLTDYGPCTDGAAVGLMRRLVVARVWLRELVASTSSDDVARASRARRGLVRLRDE